MKCIGISGCFSYKITLTIMVWWLFATSSFGQVIFTDVEDSLMADHWLGIQSLDTTMAYSGRFSSKTNQQHPYGLGFEGSFPIRAVGNNTWLKISGVTYCQKIGAKAVFVVTLVDKAGTRFWNAIDVSKVLTKPGNWMPFSDSIRIPANLTRETTIKAYLWNQNPEIAVWIDDLELAFLPVVHPSFIPAIKKKIAAKKASLKLLYQNEFYQIQYDAENFDLNILNHSGQMLVQNWQFYSERKASQQLVQQILPLIYRKTTRHQNSVRLIFETKSQYSRVQYTLDCHKKRAIIEIHADEKFLKSQEIIRTSLVFSSKLPVSAVLRANRKIDTADFQQEYWLDKQGVQFGTKDAGWSVYHTPKISSLQLKTEEQQLWVNLDYECDHPFFRYPLNPDTTNYQLEISSSSYHRGDHREYDFNINLVATDVFYPRFMKNNHGFLATYIWSEHADWTDLRTQRATYFGSEFISKAEHAVGGFVKYGIPVTKSVFYTNPDSIDNIRVSDGKFSSLELCIQEDIEFLAFLKQINACGSEICLHTPDHFTTTPSTFEEALAFMYNEFDGASWIDHGNNNGLRNNREDLVCDATLKKSPYYALDLWPTYGVRYVHNSYYEDVVEIDFWQFDASIAKPYGGFGDWYPKPDYYKHPTRSNNMIHWPTSSALFVKKDNLWQYYYSDKKLHEFVNQWETKINHCYPAWVDPQKGFWTYNEDSVLIAQPGFNKVLESMALLRDEGLLNVTTVKDYLDYRTAIDSIEYQVSPLGHIEIFNKSSQDIIGISFTTTGDFVLVNNRIPEQKIVPEGVVFWFDLPSAKRAVIRTFNNE